MNKKTLKALEESIAHWERMQDDPDCGAEPSGTDCPLCARFGGEERCYGCFVAVAEWRRQATREIQFLRSLLPAPAKEIKP